MYPPKITKKQLHDALIIRHGALLQEKLDNARVTICGLGGLGSNIAVMLARTGVGHLHLIDYDKVELTNVHRQCYELVHVGMKKTSAICDILSRINPYLDIITTDTYITPDNAPTLLKNSDIICEAFDLPENKAMLAESVRGYLRHIPYIAASGMAGFGGSNLISTRQIMPDFYICGDESSDSTAIGLMAPRVTLCAAHQANLIINLIAQKD